jgi:ribosomal protein S27AE
MIKPERFSDAQYRLSEFYDEVWVECPACSAKAVASAHCETTEARLICTQCGYSKTQSTLLKPGAKLIMAAHAYFGARLWLQMPFRNGEMVMAYNSRHLDYLEQYITATLREHKERTHFTLLEKLPRFYHEAKSREGLLKVIGKLREKG